MLGSRIFPSVPPCASRLEVRNTGEVEPISRSVAFNCLAFAGVELPISFVVGRESKAFARC